MIPLGPWAMGCSWLSSFVTRLWMETLGNAQLSIEVQLNEDDKLDLNKYLNHALGN
jgi:hypothetical protein